MKERRAVSRRGETKERILDISTNVFFENGYEATSVKMILEEAKIVTGSFYHFFPSKEALFEAVIERFLTDYASRVCVILVDEQLSAKEQLSIFLFEIQSTFCSFNQKLQGQKLHWTVQYALLNRTLEAMISPFAQMLERHIGDRTIRSRFDVNALTLAAVIIHGIEAILTNGKNEGMEEKLMEYIQLMLEIDQAGEQKHE